MEPERFIKHLPSDLKKIIYRFRHNIFFAGCVKEMLNNFYECNENLYHIYEITNGYLHKIN
jgi:hypothetical protein